MKSKKQKGISLLIVAAAMLIALGCGTTEINLETVDLDTLKTDTVNIELDDVKKVDGNDEVRVTLSMGSGELKVDSGAEEFMEGEFTYNVADWTPEVNYETNESRNRLTVRQSNTQKIPVNGKSRNEWNLRFNNDIPIDLRVDFGAGESDLDLGELQVTQLDLKFGVGDVNIDLSGNQTLTDLEVDMGAGSLYIDLDGEWENDVDIDIQGGIGDTYLRLPEHVGVRINITKGIGTINADKLQRQGDDYINEAYDNADVVVNINIQAGIGTITLEPIQ